MAITLNFFALFVVKIEKFLQFLHILSEKNLSTFPLKSKQK